METKICTICKLEKPIEDFYWSDKSKGRRRSECKECHKFKVKKDYQSKKDFLIDIRSSCHCQKCGETREYCLDFHHIVPEDKKENISRLIAGQTNKKTLFDELKKCVVLCSNCHREFHFLETKESLKIEDYISEEEDVLFLQNLIKKLEESSEDITSKNKEGYYCVHCQKNKVSKKDGICLECAGLLRRKVERPSREELKNLIKTIPFTKIGKQFGVSDKTIVKWCVYYNLPSKKSDIKRYSDDKWNLV